MKRVGIFSLAIFLILLGTSCEKSSDTGIVLSFKGETSMMNFKSTSGSYSFTDAMLGVHEIEIEMESEIENENYEKEIEIEYDFEGKYEVDLLEGTSNPKIGLAEFEPGMYNELEAEIGPVLEGGTKSLFLKGSYSLIDQETVEFEFSTSSEIEFEVESDRGFYLDEGTIIELVVTFDLAMLFEGVDFSNAVRNESDMVIIDDVTNVDLANIIKSNINLYAELEEDDDNDD